MLRQILEYCRKVWSNSHGTTAIEFSLIAPVLFLLILTGIDFSIMLFEQYSLNYAVSYAARYVYLNPASSTAQAQAYAFNLIPTLPDTVTFSVTTIPKVQTTISASLKHNFIYFSHAGVTLTAQIVQPLSPF